MIEIIHRHIIPAAYTLLPAPMAGSAATAMLLAIGLQESQFRWRRQVGGGPARGFWQFERGGGVKGVCTHEQTRIPLKAAIGQLRYDALLGQTAALHAAIEHNDVLACVFARLLLWTVPAPLPRRDEPSLGWGQYINGWRPGKPHRGTWDAYFELAWNHVATAALQSETP